MGVAGGREMVSRSRGERIACAGSSAYSAFSRFNGRKILYQMRINRDERMCLPFESPKPRTDFADTPIGFISRPWPLHLPGPFLFLNRTPQTPPPALTPAPAPKQYAAGNWPPATQTALSAFSTRTRYITWRGGEGTGQLEIMFSQNAGGSLPFFGVADGR